MPLPGLLNIVALGNPPGVVAALCQASFAGGGGGLGTPELRDMTSPDTKADKKIAAKTSMSGDD